MASPPPEFKTNTTYVFPYIPGKQVEEFLLGSRHALDLESAIMAGRAEVENAYATQLNNWVNSSRQALYELMNGLEGKEICSGLMEMLVEGSQTANDHADIAERLLEKSGPVQGINDFKKRLGRDSSSSTKSHSILGKQKFVNFKNNNLKEFKTILEDYNYTLDECLKAVDEMDSMEKKLEKHKDQFFHVSRDRDAVLLIQDGQLETKQAMKTVNGQLRSVTGKMDVLSSLMEFSGRKGERLLQQSQEKLADHLNQIEKFERHRLSTVKINLEDYLDIIGDLSDDAKEVCEKVATVLREQKPPSRFNRWKKDSQVRRNTLIPVKLISHMYLETLEVTDSSSPESSSEEESSISRNKITYADDDSSVETENKKRISPESSSVSLTKSTKDDSNDKTRKASAAQQSYGKEISNKASSSSDPNDKCHNCHTSESEPEKRPEAATRSRSPGRIRKRSAQRNLSQSSQKSSQSDPPSPTPPSSESLEKRSPLFQVKLPPSPNLKSSRSPNRKASVSPNRSSAPNLRSTLSSQCSGGPTIQEKLCEVDDRQQGRDQEDQLSPAMIEHLNDLRNAVNRVVLVERDYQAQSPEQLNLKKGDRLRLRRCEAESVFGWGWKMRVGGRAASRGTPKEQGMFPLSYVTLCNDDADN